MDGVDDVVDELNDPFKANEDFSMQVTTSKKRDSRGHDSTPPNLT